MIRLAFVISLAGALAGCMSDDGRIEGVSMGAGNAIAVNTALQMVDPWQQGVQDTDLEIPAERTVTPAAMGTGASVTSDN